MATATESLDIGDVECSAAFADRNDVIEVDASRLVAGLADGILHQDIAPPLPVLMTIVFFGAGPARYNTRPESLD